MPPAHPPLPDAAPPGRSVAYVMNAFPRLSETFIAHEIHQLERLGLALRLYAVKREPAPKVHPVVAALRAPLTHLPPVSSLSGTPLAAWLARHLPAYWRAHAAVALRRPLAWAGALATALGLAWRHRGHDGRGRLRLRKVYVKEFLQAGAIAADVLRHPGISHLHGHFCHGVATITWLAARMAGRSFSFTAHAKDLYQAELNPGDLLERKLHGARFVATCTCANAQVLRLRHARPDEVHTVYHGLDTDYFCPPPPQPAPAGEPPLVLAVGRLVEKKGFDQLLQALALLRAEGVAVRCAIVGEDGSAGPALRALAAELDLLGQVRFEGPMTQAELRTHYARAALFALPCQVMDDGDRDGFPNVLAEAMAMGVPVVSTAISGIPEMIDDGACGLLVPPRDAPALARAIGRVLGDAALRERLGREGRRRICERFDSRLTTVALHRLFSEQLARAGAAAATPAREALR